MSVTNPNTEFIANAANAAHGTSLTKDFFEALGRETLRFEKEFNPSGRLHREGRRAARVSSTRSPSLPTNHVARFHGPDVHRMYERLPA